MVDAEEKFSSLGPWNDAELAGTARENAGIGSNADLPNKIRFIAGVAQLIRRRLARTEGEADPGQPAVFLLGQVPRTYQNVPPPKRVPMLDNGLTPLSGRLWFVALDECDDDTLFRVVTDTVALGDVPTILFDPRPTMPQIRYYPSGLKNLDDYQLLPMADGDISLSQIFEAIDNIYRNCLITPDAQPVAGRLWENSNKWYPIRDAEGRIQLALKAGLVTAFPYCAVRHEQASVPGRVDLEIEESDPIDRGVTVRHAVLELKVLRSFGSTGDSVSLTETIEWIASGVRQAAAYRDDKEARAAALCCFDMRKEDSGESCFEQVRDLAKEYEVRLKRWFLFASADLYRLSSYNVG
jgi:hypothetical protein